VAGLLAERAGVTGAELAELEDHLRDQMADLADAGLSEDEAFLIAVKRMGAVDQVSQEFAREHSGRLWRQLVVSREPDSSAAERRWPVMLVLALAAAVVFQGARLIAGFPDNESGWFLRSAPLFVLPFLAAWFGWSRNLGLRQFGLAAVPFGVTALLLNAFPWQPGGSTEILAAAHLPALLWFAVAYPYMRGDLQSGERRMDFVRFTGEWAIYYVLIALGGGVLTALAGLVLEPTELVDTERLFEWVLPTGAAGAVIVAAWLVDSKQRVIENMAPVLTLVFTPLFAVMLTVSAFAYGFSAFDGVFDRELVGVFDALMVVVVGLVVYAISARDPLRPAGWMDRVQWVAVVAALLLDLVVLASMAARITDLGLTPNRVAALGLNLVLLVNLAGAACLLTRFLSGRGGLHPLERWQTGYLPVFAGWSAVVVLVLPLAFGFA
jgi:hypothetical protein